MTGTLRKAQAAGRLQVQFLRLDTDKTPETLEKKNVGHLLHACCICHRDQLQSSTVQLDWWI